MRDRLARVLQSEKNLLPIVKRLQKSGAQVLLVGGAVRDLLLGKQIKDIDIEVYHVESARVQEVLAHFGPVSLVGKSFGVFKVHGSTVDWSLPRSDSEGRKPDVVIDVHMDFKQAFQRRDLTINAMGIDLATDQLIDPWGGYHDLEQRVLRSPDIRFFVQDPLRLYRVMHFISRFALWPDKELEQVCATMSLRDISLERIEGEFEKLLLRSEQPSLGLRWLRSIGRLAEIAPELAATISIAQDPAWHPEGDVFEHTMQTLDAAAARSYRSDADKLIVLFAALCHDLGKVTTTELVDGRLTSLGHAQEGAHIACRLMARLTTKKAIIKAVKLLVRAHMLPVQFVRNGASLGAYRRLALQLVPYATLQMLADLAYADKLGRNPDQKTPLQHQEPEIEMFVQKALQAEALFTVEPPLLHGRDIIDCVPPGKKMGELLKAAYALQLEEGIKDKQELKARVIKN